MAHFAIIEDGKVTNTIVAESKAIAEEVTGKTCVEYDAADPAIIGFGYDGTNFEKTLTTQPTE
jgi:hypothetical protein